MTKYLFLLGFFVFSFSFLSGCKMSDFYSAPVANADSAPAADTDSTPVTDTDSAPVANADSAPVTDAEVIYKGIVYKNYDPNAISCSWQGMLNMRQLDREGRYGIPTGCKEGAFTSFIFFSDESSKPSDGSAFKYVHSFISSDDGDNWEETYLRVSKGIELERCDKTREQKAKSFKQDCQKNLLAYGKYRSDSPSASPFDEETTNRAPDSIKE